MPNNMTLTQEFETQRNLLTAMLYMRGTTGVVAQENAEEVTNYDANKAGDGVSPISRTAGAPGGRGSVRRNQGNLNQYTAVGEFVPEFDADGNQTKVQTSTGIWNVIYNAENRPITFSRTNNDGSVTKVTCAYDFMGRRTTKKVETIATDASASTTLYQRYLYRGYLQIACCDLTRENHPHLWLITWDPTQPVATRPLAIRKDGTWYCYGWDLTKNVCDVFSNEGYLNNTVVYSYTPYGAVTAEGSVQQPIQWSSEFNDGELGLVYYNYRHYSPRDGRWTGRDMVSEEYGSHNSYGYIEGKIFYNVDTLGQAVYDFSSDTRARMEWGGQNVTGGYLEDIARAAAKRSKIPNLELALREFSKNLASHLEYQGTQIRILIRFTCECDDGNFLFNCFSTKPYIKTKHFTVTPKDFGVYSAHSVGFSKDNPFPPLSKVNDFIDKKIHELTEKAREECEKACS